MEQEITNKEQERKDWHSGFAGGLELSFLKYKKKLRFIREYLLAKEPLRADFLVIKKERTAVIDNAVGRLFREYNIVEYKNPYDKLDLDVVWKTIAYAALYKSQGVRVNAIPIEEITISIVRSSKPIKLFDELQSSGVIVNKVYNGVYYLEGLTQIPLQIVVTNELDDPDFNAIKILRKNANKNDVIAFMTRVKYLKEKGDRINVNAVLNLLRMTNRELFEEKEGEVYMVYEAIRDLYEKDVAAMREEERKGRENRIKQFVQDEIEDNIPKEKIAKKLMTLYEYSNDEARGFVEKYSMTSSEK